MKQKKTYAEDNGFDIKFAKRTPKPESQNPKHKRPITNWTKAYTENADEYEDLDDFHVKH